MEIEVGQENPRVSEMLDRLDAFAQQTPPRNVPLDIYRRARSPIALFLAIFEAITVLIFAVMFVVSRLNEMPVAYLFLVLMVPSLLLAIGSLYSLATTRKNLADGKPYAGKVLTVKPLQARINMRTFFSVTVEFEGPGGAKTKAKDTVDSWASEYFLNARDTNQKVDVLYTPNMMGRGVLPMKMAIAYRYD